MARPSLADSLKASLSKGVHVEAAERIKLGLSQIHEEPATDATSASQRPPLSLAINNSGHTLPACLISDSVILDHQTVIRSNSDTAIPVNSLPDKPSYSDTVRQSDHNTVTPSTRQTVSTAANDITRTSQQHPQTVSYQTIPLDVLTLPYNQAVVLEYLIASGGITNARTISDATHIGIPSVRDAISRLIRRGFMPEPVTIRNAAFQGFSYVLNPVMVGHFQAAGGLEQKAYRQTSNGLTANRQTVSGTNRWTVKQTDSETPISSSIINKLTTTQTHQTDIPSETQTVSRSTIPPSNMTPSDSQGIFVLTGSAGMFWEGEGLQERQAKTWTEQFEIEPLQLKQQLEWARHDLVVNNKAAEVKKDSISWFFGVLRQTGGCYPKPSNYRSPAEIRADQMEQAVREAVEARERLAATEKELAFQDILSKSNGEAYKMLLEQAGEFAREMGGKTLEAAMRDIFIGRNLLDI